MSLIESCHLLLLPSDGPGYRQDRALSSLKQWEETEEGEGQGEATANKYFKVFILQTSSTVDLGAMTALHHTMVRKLKSCDDSELAGRHVDMSAVLADIERSQTRGGDGKEV